jgi:hypothetical protein
MYLAGLKRITLLGTPSLSNGSMMNVDSALERLHRYGAGNCKVLVVTCDRLSGCILIVVYM